MAERYQLGLPTRVLNPIVISHDPGRAVEHYREPFDFFQDRAVRALQVGQDIPREAFGNHWKAPALGLGLAFAFDRWKWIRIDPAVYYIDSLPIHVEWTDVVVVVLASLLLAVLATIYPS